MSVEKPLGREEFKNMSSADLLIIFLLKTSRGFQENDGARLVRRNGRWGTCAGCPRDPLGLVHPEKCAETNRSDHNINVLTQEGSILEYGQYVEKDKIINILLPFNLTLADVNRMLSQ